MNRIIMAVVLAGCLGAGCASLGVLEQRINALEARPLFPEPPDGVFILPSTGSTQYIESTWFWANSPCQMDDGLAEPFLPKIAGQ